MFYRILANKDTFITNVSAGTATTLATGSNNGINPALEIFARKNYYYSNEFDLSRILINFDISGLSSSIYVDATIPTSSVTYRLKMFNFEHAGTGAQSFNLDVYPLSSSWNEGDGADSINYADFGYANWMGSTSTTSWTLTGSDYLTSSYGSASQNFDRGEEDLDVDVTDIVKNWLTGAIPSNGLVVKMATAEETNGSDYYKKVFHGRETKYVDRVPYIEARWDNSQTDNRNNFAFDVSSSLYLYNFVRGQLTDISQPVYVRIQTGAPSGSTPYNTTFTASRAETGVYYVTPYIAYTAGLSASWSDVWYSGSKVYMSSTFTPLLLTGSDSDIYNEYVADVMNLKRVYTTDEQVRLKVNFRKRDYKHHQIIHSASLASNKEYIDKAYFSIVNNDTNETVVPFGTGSLEYTKLSYNKDGNYFDLWMNSFVPGFVYAIKFLLVINKDKKVIEDQFLFKVI